MAILTIPCWFIFFLLRLGWCGSHYLLDCSVTLVLCCGNWKIELGTLIVIGLSLEVDCIASASDCHDLPLPCLVCKLSQLGSHMEVVILGLWLLVMMKWLYLIRFSWWLMIMILLVCLLQISTWLWSFVSDFDLVFFSWFSSLIMRQVLFLFDLIASVWALCLCWCCLS